MSPMAFEIVAAPCCIVLALFAAPRYLKSGITTIPELIGLRYDRSTKLWFSIAYILLYICGTDPGHPVLRFAGI